MSREGPSVAGARNLMCSRCGCTHIDGVANVESAGRWITITRCGCRRWFHKTCATEKARKTQYGTRLSGPDWLASYEDGSSHTCDTGDANGVYLNFTRDRGANE